MKRQRQVARVLLATAVAALLPSVQSRAAVVTSTWTGATGNWATNINWVNVPAIGSYPHNSGTLTYDAVITNGTATVDKDIIIEKFMLRGGTLTGSYVLTCRETVRWPSGTMTGAGSTIANDGLQLGTNFLAVVSLSRTLNNNGTATLSGMNNIGATGGGVINNQGGATFDVMANIGMNGGTFNNSGTFRKFSGLGISTFSGAFNNNAAVQVLTGILQLAGGGDSPGGFNAAAGTSLVFGGGTHSLLGSSSVTGAGTVSFGGGTVLVRGGYNVTGLTSIPAGTVDFGGSGSLIASNMLITGGTMTGSNIVTVTGSLIWSNGVMSGTGKTLANGGLQIGNSDGFAIVLQRALNNAGTGNWVGTADVNATSGGVFSNLNTATFIIASNATWLGGTFNNDGIVRKTNGAGLSTFSGAFHNSNAVEVLKGTLALSGGGNSTGSFTVATGAALVFGGGTHNLGTNSVVSGAGTMNFLGGTANLNGTYNMTGTTVVSGGTANFNPAATVTGVGAQMILTAGAATFSAGDSITVTGLRVAGGTLGGVDPITVTGSLVWSNGTMTGTGLMLANGGLQMAGTNGVNLVLQRPLRNAATGTWSGAATVSASGSGTFNNFSGATFDILSDSTWTGGIITNAGLLGKTAGTGTTAFNSTFINTGTVTAQAGVLQFSNYTQLLGKTILNGGTLAGTAPLEFEGGTLMGTGTVVGAFVNWGNLLPGFSAGRIDVQGSGTLESSSVLVIELGGYMPGSQHDFIDLTGPAMLGGDLNVSFINNFQNTMTNGASFTVLTAGATLAGSFANVGSGGQLLSMDGYARFLVTYAGSNSVRLTGLSLIDTDTDGMPDWWEDMYGLSKNNPVDAALDLDGDGMNNLDEYLSGTAPNSPGSALRILEIATEDADVRVTWTAVGGKTYGLQVASSTSTNDFTDIGSVITMPAGGESITNAVHLGGATNVPAFYYRVKVVP